MRLELSILPGRLAICRLPAGSEIPAWAAAGSGVGVLHSITRTAEEVSIVCVEAAAPDTVRAERGWRALAVSGPLDFGLTGVLDSIARPLAEAGISIFAVSTFDTDYVLVKGSSLGEALEALTRAGHRVSGEV